MIRVITEMFVAMVTRFRKFTVSCEQGKRLPVLISKQKLQLLMELIRFENKAEMLCRLTVVSCSQRL